MKNFEFEASDFDGLHPLHSTGRAAQIANELLAERDKVRDAEVKEQWLKDAPVVYGEPEKTLRWSPIASTQETHTARLVDIKDLK